jgi:cytochrome c-type biogenesis protein CcmH/NrfG
MSEVQQDSPQVLSGWKTSHVYILAVLCFALGLPTGYLLHGGSPLGAPASAPAASASQPASPHGGMGSGNVTPEQMRQMADKAAQPVLAELKSKPNDPALLAKAGDVYYDAQQFSEAVKYYESSLKSDPKNPNVRSDMATAYYYLGDADRAIAELTASLQYRPNHPQTLLNLGLIKWQAKMDIEGAVAAWQKLLDTNPNFEQADQVRKMIAQARQHSNIKPGTKAKKPI